MNKQFIAWPIAWALNFDKNRHSARVADAFVHRDYPFHAKEMRLHNDMEAFVAETAQAAFEGLIVNARPYFDNLKEVHKTIGDKDIEFSFNLSEIYNGKVLICHNMRRRETI